MFTIDASVHVSALNPFESTSADSRRFLELLQEREAVVFSPALLVVEVAAAVARQLGDSQRAVAMSTALRRLPRHTIVPLDDTLLDVAVALAAAARLRGADAVYAAVAHEFGTTLVTLDAQQLQRLSPFLKTACPADILSELGTADG